MKKLLLACSVIRVQSLLYVPEGQAMKYSDNVITSSNRELLMAFLTSAKKSCSKQTATKNNNKEKQKERQIR